MKCYLISKGEKPLTKGIIFLEDELAESICENNNLEPFDLKTGEVKEPLVFNKKKKKKKNN